LEQGEPLLRRQRAMTRWRQAILHVRQLKSPVGETFPPRLRSVDRPSVNQVVIPAHSRGIRRNAIEYPC
jgi:hypothetical protein